MFFRTLPKMYWPYYTTKHIIIAVLTLYFWGGSMKLGTVQFFRDSGRGEFGGLSVHGDRLLARSVRPLSTDYP